jgi:hypothetical protein
MKKEKLISKANNMTFLHNHVLFNFGVVCLLSFNFTLSPNQNLKPITILHSDLNENSGMVYWNKKIYFINDKGNNASIYSIDTPFSGKATEIKIQHIKNKDWEEMSSNSNFIFIGDIGNNKLDREEVEIYKIKKSSFIESDFRHIDKIPFRYEKNTKQNCEAFVALENGFLFFTKEPNICTVYFLANQDSIAKKIGTLNTECLITGACISNKNLHLIGYNKKGSCYLFNVSFKQTLNVGSYKMEKINLGSYNEIGQIEAISSLNGNELIISCESSKNNPAKLYKYTF